MAPVEVLCLPAATSFIFYQCRGHGHCDGRMEKSLPLRRSISSWSLDHLSTELVVLIFEQLRDIDQRSLATLRQVSRRFESIVTPIRYRSLRLNEHIIHPEAETYFPGALQQIYAHTRHVDVRSDLDVEGVRQILDRIERLSSLRWQYVGSNLHSGTFCVPSDILSQRHLLVNKTELYVESLPLHNYDGQQQQDIYLRAIPAGNLVSLQLSRPDPPLTTRLEALKRLLLRARRLRVLDYRDRGQGTHFRFDPSSEGEECQTLPPLEDLTLQSYDWDHGPDVAARHWDFSRLRALRLVDVPAFNFLSSVDPERLAGLHTLRCDDFSAHLPADRRADATLALRRLVGRIRALRVLEITCHTHLFLPPAAAASSSSEDHDDDDDDDPLLRHAPTLRALRIRDHAGAGFGDEAPPPCPTLRVGYARRLARRLRGLRSLELDFDARDCDDPRGFLRALGAFPRLEQLTLHVQTVLRPAGLFDDDDEEEGEYPTSHAEPRHYHHYRTGTPADPDREAAQRTLAALIRARKEEGGGGAAPWRRIALVVGGWRPVLGVRRGGEAWRALNARGVFAERCFVLERAGDGDAMVLREEIARRIEG